MRNNLFIQELKNRSTLIDLIILTCLVWVFYTIWLGSYPLFTPDEGRYSEVAREMIISGDYITPRINGIVFLDKPILYYWLQASAIKLFGLTEWALRFWPALFGLIGCLVTYFAGRVLYDRRTALLSSMILASSPLYFGAAHYANLDLEVAVLISASLLFFLTGIKTIEPRLQKILLWAAYATAGLAFLTKGIIGIAFPMMIIGAWVVMGWQWNIIKKMRLISGMVIFAIIALPWYFIAQYANPEFFHFFFVTQQFTRFLSAAEFNNKTYWWFYFPIIIIGFMPWSVFLIQTLRNSLHLAWQNRRHYSTELFLLIWIALVITFFSIPKSKTIGYILPVYPALALLSGHYIASIWDNRIDKKFMVSAMIYIIASLAIAITFLTSPFTHIIDLPNGAMLYLYLTGIVFFISAVTLTTLLLKQSLKLVITGFAVSICIFLLVLVASLDSVNTKTIKPLTTKLAPMLIPGDEVATYLRYYQDLPLYLGTYVSIIADWNDPSIERNDNWVRELWYGKDFRNSTAGKERLINENTFWQRWSSNKRMYVLVHKKYLSEFQAKSNNQYNVIDHANEVTLFSNLPVIAITR